MNFKKRILPLLVLFALILAGLTGCQSLSAGSATAAANSPVGMWTGIVTSEDGTTFKVGVVFSSDGTMTVMDDGVLGLGVWEKVSGNQYRFTFWDIIIQQDGSRLYAKVRSTIELSDDKEQYTDSGYFQITDPDGSVIAEGPVTATFVRNHVEPMP